MSNRKKMLCIEGRNRHVQRRLKETYADSVHGGLRVFCVSNVSYEESSRRPQVGMDGDLRTISGIPEVRKFCYSLSAESRLRDAIHFLRTTIPSLIASISMHAKDDEKLPQKPNKGISPNVSNISRIKDQVSVFLYSKTILSLVLTDIS
jgi:hypothetical protein